MDRVKTGIPGLDELVLGGVPQGSSILIAGGPGAGKTILAMQYLYEGATKMDEPGLFVTLESNLKDIVWNMESFSWDIKSLQDSNKLKIYRLNLATDIPEDRMAESIDRELEVIASMVKEMGAKRLVVDSTTAFGLWTPNPGRLRAVLYKFASALKDMDCTTLMTTEIKGGKTTFSAFGVEEFLTDGVIALYFTPPHRNMFIRKMRGTNHSKSVHPFEINEKGINIKAKDEVMWDAVK